MVSWLADRRAGDGCGGQGPRNTRGLSVGYDDLRGHFSERGKQCSGSYIYLLQRTFLALPRNLIDAAAICGLLRANDVSKCKIIGQSYDLKIASGFSSLRTSMYLINCNKSNKTYSSSVFGVVVLRIFSSNQLHLGSS